MLQTGGLEFERLRHFKLCCRLNSVVRFAAVHILINWQVHLPRGWKFENQKDHGLSLELEFEFFARAHKSKVTIHIPDSSMQGGDHFSSTGSLQFTYSTAKWKIGANVTEYVHNPLLYFFCVCLVPVHHECAAAVHPTLHRG